MRVKSEGRRFFFVSQFAAPVIFLRTRIQRPSMCANDIKIKPGSNVTTKALLVYCRFHCIVCRYILIYSFACNNKNATQRFTK